MCVLHPSFKQGGNTEGEREREADEKESGNNEELTATERKKMTGALKVVPTEKRNRRGSKKRRRKGRKRKEKKGRKGRRRGEKRGMILSIIIPWEEGEGSKEGGVCSRKKERTDE